MKSAQIRQAFLDFFSKRGHQIVPSAPLIPADDPTLLFTNAGMVPFKEVFLGIEKRDYSRAVSVQRCVRAGGKHNDLENVGYTARHHTFFEMLGNFSFGDYFKREAITFAWEFLTQVLNIPKERLWVTVYVDDDEAADIWLKEISVDPSRFSRCGEKDNFWSMGDVGPCGPCTEVFYDHGPEIPGGPPGSEDSEADRYIEIWNLVFMQYQRDAQGKLTPLPKPSVDTGMGLERIAAVMQGVHDNYEIDTFQTLIKVIAKMAGTNDLHNVSLKVIADHIRSCSFLIIDGVVPSNEGRGYVLRRIIRRALRHGHKLGLQETFFYQLVASLVAQMQDVYPELAEKQAYIEQVLQREEEQFARTLEQGLRVLEKDLANLHGKQVPGETIFKLYDTYGFPVDLTGDIARERALTLDFAGFEQEMETQRQRAQSQRAFATEEIPEVTQTQQTEFTGYERLIAQSKVAALLHAGEAVDKLSAGQKGAVILQATPFYAEAGGQVGDRGELMTGNNCFNVEDTQKAGAAFLHIGTVKSGELKVGDEVNARVDQDYRQAVMINHSATHLLNAALRQVLGEHIIQKGSLVAADRLRFDFTHSEPLTRDQIILLEQMVNQAIRANYVSHIELTTVDEAKASGAIAAFGEKYAAKVRMLSMGDFSKELCGGTHVEHTGDIGAFKIINETSVAAGIRRIEAITGEAVISWVQQLELQLFDIAQQLKTEPDHVLQKVTQITSEQKSLVKELQHLQTKLASLSGTDLTSQVQDINGIKVLTHIFEGVDIKVLRQMLDQLRDKLGKAVVVLVNIQDDKINVIAGISKSAQKELPSAREFVAAICGKGGGRDDMAQGGGRRPLDLDDKIKGIVEMVRNRS